MKKILILLTILIISLLAACSVANHPEQIAVYPKDGPISIYPNPSDSKVIYHATLEIAVSNVGRAAERAKEIAFEQGGYLVSAQSWYRDGAEHTTLVLAVPAYRFETTREQILQLGELSGEWISSETASIGKDFNNQFSQITIHLNPKETWIPDLSAARWRPVRTVENAWHVFGSIFGFLLDIVIWVLVVVGPFALIGVLSVRVYRWWHQKKYKTA